MTGEGRAPGEWEELAAGTFVRRYRFFNQNIGLIVGRRSAAVLDTRSSLRQGRQLLEDIRRITQLPVTVVNTHHHFDHTFGNAAFLPADIWGHERCAATLREFGPQTRDRVAADMPEFAEEVSEVQIVPPTHTFGERTDLDLGGRSIGLRYLGRGHTDNDTAVIVPGSGGESGVVFAGDLVEQGSPPYFGDAYPLDWPGTLERMLRLTDGAVVPGHGEIVDRAFVQAQLEELGTAARAAREAWAEGLPWTETAGRIGFPEAFARDLARRSYGQLEGEI